MLIGEIRANQLDIWSKVKLSGPD